MDGVVDRRADFQDTFWSQGMLLMTPTVRRMPREWRDEQSAIEARCVFAHFDTGSDEGRSRIRLLVCDTALEAQTIVTEHNTALIKTIRERLDAETIEPVGEE